MDSLSPEAHDARNELLDQGLDFDGEPPEVASLALRWRAVLETRRRMVSLLPAEEASVPR
jgi:hypothetical protein